MGTHSFNVPIVCSTDVCSCMLKGDDINLGVVPSHPSSAAQLHLFNA